MQEQVEVSADPDEARDSASYSDVQGNGPTIDSTWGPGHAQERYSPSSRGGGKPEPYEANTPQSGRSASRPKSPTFNKASGERISMLQKVFLEGTHLTA